MLSARLADAVATAGKGAADKLLVGARRQPRNRVQPPLARAQLWDALHQLGRVGVERRLDHLLRGAQFDHLTGIEHGNPVAELGDDAEVVGDEDDRQPALASQVVEQRQDLRLNGHIERRCRLVGDDHIRVVAQGQGDADALPHATRKLVRVAAEDPPWIGDANLSQQFQRAFAGFLRGDALVCLDGFEKLRADGEQGMQRGQRILEDIGDPVASDPAQLGLGQADEILTVEGDGTALDHARWGGDQAQDRQGGDGLPRATFTDDTQALARGQVKVDMAHRLELARAKIEAGGQVRYRQCVLWCGPGLGRSRRGFGRRGGGAGDFGGGLRAAERAGFEPRVERVADAVSEQVHPHDDDQDHGPGHEGRVRTGDQRRAGFAQHGTEVGLGRLRAQAKEGQARGFQDHPTHGGRGRDDNGGNDVGQNFADDDAQVTAPVEPCGIDVFEVHDGHRHAANVAGKEGDVDGGDGNHGVEQARAKHGDDGERQQDIGEAHQGIDTAHDQVVGQAAEVTGDDAHACPDHRRDHGGGKADEQRQARAPEQAAEQVAAQVVGAQQRAFGEGPLEAARGVDHVRVGQRQQRRDQRDQHQRGQDDHAEQRQSVAGNELDQRDHVLILESSRVWSTSTAMLNST